MIDSIIQQLRRSIDSQEYGRNLMESSKQLAALNSKETEELFDSLLDFAAQNSKVDWAGPVMTLLSAVPSRDLSDWLDDVSSDPIIRLYESTPGESVLRSQLLAMLATTGDSDAWIRLISENPPLNIEGIEIAFAPFTHKGSISLNADQLQQLFDHGADHISVAASIFELANHAFRTDSIHRHPADDRKQQLCELADGLISRLEIIESGKLPEGSTPDSVAQIVQESVSLLIACMDTLALLGYEPAISKLSHAVELKHRRIKVEAAAALARLDDENGKEKLIELAQHPVIRPRVIAYAKELGIDSKISLEHQGPIAEAESSLAMWLAMPEQMSLAPSSIRLIDQRELYWPSYENPVECFLFEFEYGSGENAFRNIGISGPLTHAFTSDLRHLDHSDQFCAFAGWQTISDEIYFIPIERSQAIAANITNQLNRTLENLDADEIEPKTFASFFGDYVLIGTADVESKPATFVISDSETIWIECGNDKAPIDWQLAFDIWKGQKLLSSFNPSFR